MPNYPDRRSQYQNTLPWEVAAVVSADIAKREDSPRNSFRVVTSERQKSNKEWIQNEKGEWVQEMSSIPANSESKVQCQRHPADLDSASIKSGNGSPAASLEML